MVIPDREHTDVLAAEMTVRLVVGLAEGAAAPSA